MRSAVIYFVVSLVVLPAFVVVAQQQPIQVKAGGTFPVKIVGTNKPIPVVLEQEDDEPWPVEIVNPTEGPIEIFTSGVLPVEVIAAPRSETTVPRFTVLGFTEATYRGGKLGGPLGASEKCQGEFGEGAVMCRESFVKDDFTAVRPASCPPQDLRYPRDVDRRTDVLRVRWGVGFRGVVFFVRKIAVRPGLVHW